MNFNQATIDWAKGKLTLLANLHGYPKEDKHIAMYAKAALRIAHPVVVLARWQHAPITDEMLLADPATLDAVTINSEKLGTVNPMDWLVEKAFEENKFMPAPMELRVIFDKEFPCADGVTPAVEED